MAWTKILYTLVVTGFLVFIFVFQPPHAKDGRAIARKSGPRLKLHKPTAKVNPKLDHISFDPEVAKVEQAHDDDAWEREYYLHNKKEEERKRKTRDLEGLDHDLMADQEAAAARAKNFGFHELRDQDDTDEDLDADYLSDEHFNVSERFTTLFLLIDTNPSDGFISFEELMEWQLQQAKNASLHRSDREMQATDKNKDGFVTLKEIFHDETEGDELKSPVLDNEDADWRFSSSQQFPLADVDGDGKLNRDEFNDFNHPEDSDNPKLHQWQRQTEIRHRDKDHDKKLSYDEFYANLYNELRDEDDPLHHAVRSGSGSDPHGMKDAVDDAMRRKHKSSKAMFEEMDSNNDGFITEEELQPVMSILVPGEKYYAIEQARIMISEADTNKDGKLTLAEMIEHPYSFYNIANDEEEYNEDMHDEFRR